MALLISIQALGRHWEHLPAKARYVATLENVARVRYGCRFRAWEVRVTPGRQMLRQA